MGDFEACKERLRLFQPWVGTQKERDWSPMNLWKRGEAVEQWSSRPRIRFDPFLFLPIYQTRHHSKTAALKCEHILNTRIEFINKKLFHVEEFFFWYPLVCPILPSLPPFLSPSFASSNKWRQAGGEVSADLFGYLCIQRTQRIIKFVRISSIRPSFRPSIGPRCPRYTGLKGMELIKLVKHNSTPSLTVPCISLISVPQFSRIKKE